MNTVMSESKKDLLRFHITWMTGQKTEVGTELSTGVTLEAESMLEALAAFHRDVTDREPVYVLALDAVIHKS